MTVFDRIEDDLFEGADVVDFGHEFKKPVGFVTRRKFPEAWIWEYLNSNGFVFE